MNVRVVGYRRDRYSGRERSGCGEDVDFYMIEEAVGDGLYIIWDGHYLKETEAIAYLELQKKKRSE